jgi:uncharacterized protein YidB (DUF937 family)
MSLLQTAAELFIKQVGGSTSGQSFDLGNVSQALQKLLPTNGGDLDIAALLQQFSGQGGQLASMASSLLSGNGGGIDIAQLIQVLGKPQVDAFAQDVGVDSNQAATGLAGILPQLLSGNGDTSKLLTGLAGSAAKGMLGKLF